jgi:hypothetical protein
MEDLIYAKKVAEIEKQQRQKARDLIRLENDLIMKERVVALTLTGREQESKASTLNKKMAELDALLNPPAPKTTKTKTKTTTKTKSK